MGSRSNCIWLECRKLEEKTDGIAVAFQMSILSGNITSETVDRLLAISHNFHIWVIKWGVSLYTNLLFTIPITGQQGTVFLRKSFVIIKDARY